MATCRVIVNAALRKLGVLGAGREPRDVDGQDAFDALRAMYRAMINAGAFGRLCDVIPTGDSYTAKGMERIFRNSDATLSVTLPETVNDTPFGCRYYGTVITVETVGSETIVTVETAQPVGCVTTPRDCSVVVISRTPSAARPRDFIYDGHQKRWQSLYDLDGRQQRRRCRSAMSRGLASLLATTIADQFGGSLTQPTVSAARIFQSSLTNRYSTPSPISAGIFM
jgi:hypothetical protein